MAHKSCTAGDLSRPCLEFAPATALTPHMAQTDSTAQTESKEGEEQPMSHTPPENPYSGRDPERPRWGQSKPEGEDRPGGQPAPEGSPYGQNPYGGSSHYGQPDYGQSPYGQPSYGQPSPYGQPSSSSQGSPYAAAPASGVQHSGYAGGPAPQPPAASLKRPLMLVLAMVSMLAGGVTAVILSFYTFSWLTSVSPGTVDGQFWTEFEQEIRRSSELEGMSPEEAFETVMFTLGSMVVIGGFVLLALYTMFAFVGTLTGVGRILATIFLAGSVTLVPFGVANLILVALSAAAIVFLWLPESNAYFREKKSRKQRVGPGGYPPQAYTGLPGQPPYDSAPYGPGPGSGQSGTGYYGPGPDGPSGPAQR